jgi:hypothetical protein
MIIITANSDDSMAVLVCSFSNYLWSNCGSLVCHPVGHVHRVQNEEKG